MSEYETPARGNSAASPAETVILRHRVSPSEPDDRLQRSIQYAAASRLYHWRLGILDRPLSRRVKNTDLILRSLRSKRLEGWTQRMDSRPSFETRLAPLLRMRSEIYFTTSFAA